ncbi:MAG: InlB B-repeat-containing protein, partial [Lachnospiraceae bacterium]
NLTTEDGKEIIVYAQWTKDTYSITYQLDGGKNNSKNPKKYAVDTDTITLLTPSKTGYEFKGWFETDSEGQLSEERKTEIVKGSTGNLKLTAKWEAMKYEIKLNPNTTVYLEEAKQTPITWTPYAYEEDVTPAAWESLFVPTDEYKNTGYGILYWSTKPNGSGTKYYPGKVYRKLATSGTIELYAKWGLKKYTISYENTDGVKNSNPTTYTYHATNKVNLKDLTKTGYSFDGWYTDPSFEETSKVTAIDCSKCEDITLYAKFTPITYTVTLMPNGTDVTAKENLDEEFAVDYDETFTLAADSYTKAHYYIAYWSTKANGSGTKIKSGEVKNLTTKSSITLYPKWELISYDITYNNVVFEGEKVVNKNPATYKYSATKDVKLNNPTRPGYVFGGWYSDDTTAVGFNPEVATRITKIEKTKDGNIELYAYWTPIRYTIKLEKNAKDAESGSITIGSADEKIEIGYGDAVTFAQNSYKRKGYILTGFNTKSNGRGTMYGFGELSYIYSTKANSTVKVYAIWGKVDTQRVTGVSLSTTEDGVVALFEQNDGCSEYEVAISSSITMRNKNTFTVQGNGATFFGLERGQRYFVRVREIRYDSCGNEI